MRRIRLVAIGVFVVAGSLEGQGLPTTLRLGSDTVRLIDARVEASLHGGALKPRNESDGFLIISFVSSDTALDANKSSLDAVATACGRVMVAEQETLADGGGLMNGTATCTYIVPKATQSVVLRLARYPEVTVKVRRP